MLLTGDIQIALLILVIVVAVFIANRIGVLPKGGIPIVVGAIVAVFGWRIWRDRRQSALRKQMEDLQKQLEARDAALKKMKTDVNIADRQVDESRAALQSQVDAMQKEILLTREDNAEKKKAIDEMDATKVREEFRKAFATAPNP